MTKVTVVNLISYKPITLESIFGEDSDRISDACSKVAQNWSYPCDGLSHANYPDINEFQKILESTSEGVSFDERKKFVERWYAEHPEELVNEQVFRQKWEAQSKKLFRAINGIAKLHGVDLIWHGNSDPCCGDQWDVLRDDEAIARICC